MTRGKKSLAGFFCNFINNVLLIIFVLHDNFYLFYFGKVARYKQREGYSIL